jgi:hypothetical protein
MLFKHKPKPSLLDAIFLVNDARVVAYEYLRDQQYMPNEEELRLLDVMSQALLRNHTIVEHITHNLHRRLRGEPEEVKKFTGPDAVDFNDPA